MMNRSDNYLSNSGEDDGVKLSDIVLEEPDDSPNIEKIPPGSEIDKDQTHKLVDTPEQNDSSKKKSDEKKTEGDLVVIINDEKSEDSSKKKTDEKKSEGDAPNRLKETYNFAKELLTPNKKPNDTKNTLENSRPTTLTILIQTRIANREYINYYPYMTAPKTSAKKVLFNPLVELHKNIVVDIPPNSTPDYLYNQFFNSIYFSTLLNRTLHSYDQPKNRTLEQATEKGIISKNIDIILSTLFKPNNKFYIDQKPYTIFGYEWINKEWSIDANFETKNQIYRNPNLIKNTKIELEKLFNPNVRSSRSGANVTDTVQKYQNEQHFAVDPLGLGSVDDKTQTVADIKPIVEKVVDDITPIEKPKIAEPKPIQKIDKYGNPIGRDVKGITELEESEKNTENNGASTVKSQEEEKQEGKQQEPLKKEVNLELVPGNYLNEIRNQITKITKINPNNIQFYNILNMATKNSPTSIITKLVEQTDSSDKFNKQTIITEESKKIVNESLSLYQEMVVNYNSYTNKKQVIDEHKNRISALYKKIFQQNTNEFDIDINECIENINDSINEYKKICDTIKEVDEINKKCFESAKKMIELFIENKNKNGVKSMANYEKYYIILDCLLKDINSMASNKYDFCDNINKLLSLTDKCKFLRDTNLDNLFVDDDLVKMIEKCMQNNLPVVIEEIKPEDKPVDVPEEKSVDSNVVSDNKATGVVNPDMNGDYIKPVVNGEETQEKEENKENQENQENQEVDSDDVKQKKEVADVVNGMVNTIVDNANQDGGGDIQKDLDMIGKELSYEQRFTEILKELTKDLSKEQGLLINKIYENTKHTIDENNVDYQQFITDGSIPDETKNLFKKLLIKKIQLKKLVKPQQNAQYSQNSSYSPYSPYAQNSSYSSNKWTYYVKIDLNLYPGESIPLEDYSSLVCQFRYEKIREIWAELFGTQYAPGIFTKPSDSKPKNKTVKNDNNPNVKKQPTSTVSRVA